MLSDQQPLPVESRRRSPLGGYRLRDRLFPVLTAIAGCALFWGSQEVSDYVKTMNSARVLAALMAGAMAEQPATTAGPAGSTAGTGTRDGHRSEAARLQRQIGTVEVVAYAWERIMWAAAGLLLLAAVLSAILARARVLALLAAMVILAGTVLTVVGMLYLVDPDWGGMPPLPKRSYVYVAAVQSAYGLILLAAFARRPQRAKLHAPA